MRPGTAAYDVREKLKHAADFDTRFSIVMEGLKHKIASMMMVEPDGNAPATRILALGLDLLVAVELRNWISKSLGANTPAMDLLSANTVGVIISLIVDRLVVT